MDRDSGDCWGIGWMVFALILLAVIVVLTSLMPPVLSIDWGILWQAAAALATAGAAVIALRVATQDARWRLEQRSRLELEDKHYSIGLVPSFIEHLSGFSQFDSKFEAMKIQDPTSVMSARCALNALTSALNQVDISKVSSVALSAGTKLSITKYQLGLVAVMLPHNELTCEQFDLRKKALRGNVRKARQSFSEAYNLLQTMVNRDLD